jgi:hypothetical protein
MVATCFLNSGNRKLDYVARNWASDNGYLIKLEYGKKMAYCRSRRQMTQILTGKRTSNTAPASLLF